MNRNAQIQNHCKVLDAKAYPGSRGAGASQSCYIMYVFACFLFMYNCIFTVCIIVCLAAI